MAVFYLLSIHENDLVEYIFQSGFLKFMNIPDFAPAITLTIASFLNYLHMQKHIVGYLHPEQPIGYCFLVLTLNVIISQWDKINSLYLFHYYYSYASQVNIYSFEAILIFLLWNKYLIVIRNNSFYFCCESVAVSIEWSRAVFHSHWPALSLSVDRFGIQEKIAAAVCPLSNKTVQRMWASQARQETHSLCVCEKEKHSRMKESDNTTSEKRERSFIVALSFVADTITSVTFCSRCWWRVEG